MRPELMLDNLERAIEYYHKRLKTETNQEVIKKLNELIQTFSVTRNMLKRDMR